MRQVENQDSEAIWGREGEMIRSQIAHLQARRKRGWSNGFSRALSLQAQTRLKALLQLRLRIAAVAILFVPALMLCSSGHLSAAEITLRLMRADAPDQKVSTAITEIDIESLEKKEEAKRVDAQAAAARGGDQSPKDKQLKPRSKFDRYSNYMRGIVIDGEHPFHRTYKGSYLGRSDEIRLDLNDGEHRIDPGNHRFSIAGGKVTTTDPSLKVKGEVIDVLLYPVTIIAIDGSAVRPMPAEVGRLPVSPRLFWKEDTSLVPLQDMVAGNATFKRMTLYMIANAGVPSTEPSLSESHTALSYRIVPSERRFQLSPDGITILDSQGKPASDRGVYTEGRFTIVLPKIAVPVTIKGDGVTVRISGPAGSFSGAGGKKPVQLTFNAFSAEDGANIRFGYRGENGPHTFRGDFGRFPKRRLLFDSSPVSSGEPRLFSVSMPAESVQAGKSMSVRIETRDAIDAPTITPVQVAAFLLTDPLLREDGTLLSNPDESTPLSSWHSLTVRSTDEADIYLLDMPADLASNVYWLRIVAGPRGNCSPRSALQADFVQGVIRQPVGATLSVFCPSGRRAFYRGTGIPFSVVIKSSLPSEAGTMRLLLKGERNEILLLEKNIAANEPGRHGFHFKLKGTATAGLIAGDYSLLATIGKLTSNSWPLRIVQPRDRNGIPSFEETFCSVNVDVGSEYLNQPESIRMANDKRTILDRHAAIRGRRSSVEFIAWSLGGSHENYQGRDNSSEIAQVEMLLRGEMALPAHEIYYYQNHFEALSEALAHHGIDQINSSPCFSILSLDHSLEDLVNSKLRQHQLIAQIGGKFENFIGMNPMEFNTSPLGNAEIVDPARHAKMLKLAENFKAKYGFPIPNIADAIIATNEMATGKEPTNAKTRPQWEAWMRTVNGLISDYYSKMRTAVDGINPSLLLSNRGPSWGGSTLDGNYPALSNINQSPQTIFLACKDGNRDFIWEFFSRTKFHRISGQDIWPIDTFAGTGLNKQNAGMALMAGAKGFGYMSGGKPELGAAHLPWDCSIVADARDIRLMLDTYGPLFSKLDHRGKVGIYYPFHQSMYDAASHFRFDTLDAMHSALLQLAMMGYTADVLTEEMIDRGELGQYKVVVAPLLYYVLPKQRAALEGFIEGGGTILAGSQSTLSLKGGKKIDLDFRAFSSALHRWSVQAPLDAASAYIQGELRRTAPVMRTELEKVFLPHARPTNDRMLIQTASAGKARYTFACNFLFPSFMGTTRLTGNTLTSFFAGEVNEGLLLPHQSEIEFPAGNQVFDLFSQEQLKGRPLADGRIAVTCDLSQSPFRILVSLPEAIESLRIERPAEVTLGRSFPITITPLGKTGPQDVRVPVQLRLTDSSGKSLAPVFGVSGKDSPPVVDAGVGYEPGVWKLEAMELVSGRTAVTTLQVKPADTQTFGKGIEEIDLVSVERIRLVREFLSSRLTDGQTVVVLLDEAQMEKRGKLAAALVDGLRSLKIKAELLKTNAPGVFAKGERIRSFGQFTEMNPQQFIDHHLILLGGEGENVLLEELQQSQLFERPMSASYPGRGRGIVSFVRSPFAYGRDVLCLMTPDNEGLQAAVDRLKELGAQVAGNDMPELTKEENPASTPIDVPGELKPGGPLANVDGVPAQVISVSPDGQKIAIGTSGFSKNVFVLEQTGKILTEDKVGHVHAHGLEFLPDGVMAVVSDDRTWLREADGKLRWQIHARYGEKVHVDSQGRYVIHASKDYFNVYDLSLKKLWEFDEWNEYSTTRELLFGRRSTLIGVAGNGAQIVYRLAGKAPGIAGVQMDAIIFAEARTGKELRRVDVDVAVMREEFNIGERQELTEISLHEDGKLLLLHFESRYEVGPQLLLDTNLKRVSVDRLKTPPYFGEKTPRLYQQIIWERRLLFVAGDALCISNPTWTDLQFLRVNQQILGLDIDQERRRIAVSDHDGEITVFDEKLAVIWRAHLPTGARLKFLEDGRLAAGTVRGKAVMFSAAGKQLWEQSLNRYVPQEEVEKRWAEIERTPYPGEGSAGKWWDRVKASVPLSEDEAKLNGSVQGDKTLTSSSPGEPFGTYLVEWRFSSKTESSVSLLIVEDEKAAPNVPKVTSQRISLTGRAGVNEQEQYAILRLSDRPENFMTVVRCNEGGEAESSVSIRRLLFPSKNLIRMDGLYRGDLASTYVDPPATVNLFMNVKEEGEPHDAVQVEPTALLNGRMLEIEPELRRGLWWGSGSTAHRHLQAIIPTYSEIVLPRKRVVSLIVLAEDPSLERGKTLTVDAFIEARETRKNLSEFEKRQLSRGFWLNVVKFRNNDSPYNVFKLKEPIFTRKIRVYVLEGHSSLSEVEIYGALPERERK